MDDDACAAPGGGVPDVGRRNVDDDGERGSPARRALIIIREHWTVLDEQGLTTWRRRRADKLACPSN